MEAENAKPAARNAKVIAIALLLAGLVVGGGTGAVLASTLSSGAAPAKQTASTDEHGDEADEEEHTTDAKKAYPIYLIEDMVLNPSGSQGTRFLMVTVALELRDTEATARLAERDAQLRDRILTVLAAKSVPELVAPDSAREALRTELRDSTARLFPRGTVRRVYLPKFVIQ
jgi:flagellar protein FliL